MNTIILYKSKYGAGKEIAERMALELGISAVSLEEFHEDLSQYEVVILGSSVYVGMIDKEMKLFCEQNESILLEKKVLFYTSAISKEKEALEKVWADNFSKSLLEHLYYKDMLGGKLNFPKMNFFEKNVIRLINKKANLVRKEQMKENVDLLDNERIQKFISQVNAV